MVKNKSRFTALDSFVDKHGPICYGILMPGENYPNGIPVIKVKNIIGGKVIEKDLLLTSPKIHQQYKRSEVKTGDLLLTIRGTTGRIAIVSPRLSGANITQDTARIRVSTTDSPLYVYYALQSPSVQQQIVLNTVGQAVKGINISEVKKLKILHPDRHEQQKIAKILSTWDEAITITEQLLANSQQQKKALMQQLLTGKKRFGGFEQQWKCDRLEKFVGKIYGGGTPPRDNPSYWNGDIPWVTVKDLKGLIVHGAQEHINTSGLSESAASLVPAGTVIIATRMAVGKAVVATCDVAINQDLKAISESKYIQSKYLHLWFLMNAQQIERMGTGSTVKGVQISTIKALKMKIPPSLKEQQKIASVLSVANHEIETLKQKLECLKQEKKALMQQLLTGKRRVKIGDK